MMLYPDIRSLLPHRRSMLLVERLVDVQEKTATAETTAQQARLFLREDGTLSPELCCELIAQGFGACEAYRRIQKGLSIDGGGYLSNIRDMEVFAPAHQTDILTIRTEKTDECFNTYIVRGEIYCRERKLAQATVYIFMWQNAPVK